MDGGGSGCASGACAFDGCSSLSSVTIPAEADLGPLAFRLQPQLEFVNALPTTAMMEIHRRIRYALADNPVAVPPAFSS